MGFHRDRMLLAAASLALALACARIVEEQSVTLSIGDDLSCHATVALNKSIEDEESMIIGIQYILPAGITDLRVYDTSGRLEHRQTQRDSDILFHIPFSEPLKTGGSRTVYIEYDKADCVRRADDSFELSARFSLLSPTSLFRITVILPEGYVLPVELNREPSQLRPVISPNAVIRTDGRKLEFEWSLRDLSPEDPLWFFVRFNPIARGASPYWALLAAVAVAAAFRLGQHLPLAHREPRAFGFVLREDERRVTDALLSAGGELKQNDLAREVGYSKAKVSYLVRDLEKRGVVKKSPLGRTNRIRLLVRKEELA